MCLFSFLSPQLGTALTLRGNFIVNFWLLRQKLPAHVAMVQGKERESSTDCIWEDTMAQFEFCKSMDTNLLLASVTKWEDMGCTSGTNLEYSLLLGTHEM